jgi:hypothetical protein
MARRTPTPSAPPRSRKSLAPLVAYSRKVGGGDDAAPPEDPGSETAVKKGEPKIEKATPEKDEPATVEAPEPAKVVKPEPEPPTSAHPERGPAGAESKGAPPAPAPAPAPAPVAAAAPKVPEPLGPIYEPLPKPKDIPVEDPEMAAPPPGIVPRGDSRSMRRREGSVEEFVLIYRFQNAVVSRAGVVGKRGRWKVVEYPTMASASHAYAQECSRLTSQGFADYRG